MNWYYIDGPLRVGPLNDTEWEELVSSGKIGSETLVWHEGMDKKWIPYAQITPPEPVHMELPEVAAMFEALAQQEDPQAFAARVADLDYPVNLSRCVSRAWGVFKAHFWELVVAASLVLTLLLASSRLPLLEYIVPMLLQGVLFGGLYKMYLQRLRGEPASFQDLFAGFERVLFQQLALQTLLIALVTQLCFVPALIAMKMKGITLENIETTFAADPQTALVLMLVFLACSIPAVYFGFCWMFAIPLVVDKGMAFWPAMQLSRAKVLQHPWRIGLFSVIAGAIGLAGAAGFGVGVIFTLPLYFLIKLCLYEEIFPPATTRPADPQKQE